MHEFPLQLHGFGLEYPRIHVTDIFNDRAKAHLIKDIAIDIDARGNLDQLQPVGP